MWVAADRNRLVSRVGSDCFPFVFNTQGPVMVDILPQKSTLTATYCVEAVLPGVIKPIRQQPPTVGTSKTFSFRITPVPTKPRSL